MSKLKDARLAAGLSQSELAKASGVSYRMVQYYEQGVKDINGAAAITVAKLAKTLGKRSEDLLEGDI